MGMLNFIQLINDIDYIHKHVSSKEWICVIEFNKNHNPLYT